MKPKTCVVVCPDWLNQSLTSVVDGKRSTISTYIRWAIYDALKNDGCKFERSNPNDFSNGEVKKKSKAKTVRVPFEKIRALYNDLLPNGHPCKDMWSKRRSRVRNIWTSNTFDTLDSWEQYFIRITTSDFLMGKVAGKNGNKFRVSIDFLLREDVILKVWEGYYDNKR